jgi:poly-gamma-glutamate capsule biosynthesis protein CapA/YwtB (metallophosphatase superfamily)
MSIYDLIGNRCRLMRKFRIVATIALCLMLAGCGGFPGATNTPPAATPEPATTAPAATPAPTPTAAPTPTPAPTPEPTPTPAPEEANIMAVGDIMFHNPIIVSADKMVKDGYDFTYCFQYVKDILSGADLALGNFECTLVKSAKEISLPNSKSFGAPFEAADALKWAGFDILSTANNHCNDRGRDNVILTAQVMAEKGIMPIGTRAAVGDKPYGIKDVNGIKIGFTAFTFNSRNGDLVNTYSTSSVSGTVKKISDLTVQMRAEGAEAVVVFIHWGAEYQRTPNSFQKKVAQGLADAGVDIIFGSHPHWMQTVDVLTGAKTGKKTLVAYSLGNFISNQRSEYSKTNQWKYSEDAIILSAKLVRQPDGAVAFAGAQYLPTWTFLWTKSGQRYYTVVPLEKAIASPADFGMNSNPKGSDMKKANLSLMHTQDLLADAVSRGILTPMTLD